jgi:predicted lipid-binding transport protein (Tim44 family)
MPTRKQRRRREKDFRHDVRVYEVDDEGNEVPIAELRSREEKQEKADRAKPSRQQKARPARGMREVPAPSWERALKRGGMMGGLMVVVFVFLLKNGPLVERIAIGVFYALAFVPLTYWVDRTAYRSYQKRLARSSSGKKR